MNAWGAGSCGKIRGKDSAHLCVCVFACVVKGCRCLNGN